MLDDNRILAFHFFPSSFPLSLSKELFGFLSLCSHVDILSEPLNSCLHVFHHVIETTVKGDWSILVVEFNEEI